MTALRARLHPYRNSNNNNSSKKIISRALDKATISRRSAILMAKVEELERCIHVTLTTSAKFPRCRRSVT